MNEILANMRWLCLPSESLGQDWFEKSRLLDNFIQEEGMDLAEEATFLLFSDIPSEILDGGGQCFIARSVIGPKKNVRSPMILKDWVAAPVWRRKLQGKTLVALLEEAEDSRKESLKLNQGLTRPFMIVVKRRLLPELIIEAEVLFNE